MDSSPTRSTKFTRAECARRATAAHRSMGTEAGGSRIRPAWVKGVLRLLLAFGSMSPRRSLPYMRS